MGGNAGNQMMGGGGNSNQMGGNGGNQMMGGGGNGNLMGGGGNSNQMGGGNGNQMGGGGRNQMGMMNQNQGMGGGGMGGGSINSADVPQSQSDRMPSQQERPNSRGSSVAGNVPSSNSSHDSKTPEERAAWLRKLKEDIAQREREAAELEASLGVDKRKNDGGDGDLANKRPRKDQEQNESTAV